MPVSPATAVTAPTDALAVGVLPGDTAPGAEPVAFNSAPLFLLAIGTFAVGTEAFMIAAILPKIASSFAVSLQVSGQLIAVFALTYALSSPLLTALTGNFNRRRLLIFCIGAFAAANLVASLVTSYWALVAARVLLAVFAGLYVPNANALASVLAPPAQRGRALAIVNGGLTVAVALGVPLGAFVGNTFGWRMTFAGVALLASIGFIGLLLGMPRALGAGLPGTTLAERIAVVRQPGALPALLVTTLWAIGAYTMYTFIAAYLAQVAALPAERIGYVLFLWGFAALLGLISGGAGNDRFGSNRVIASALPLGASALFGLSAIAYGLTPAQAWLPILLAVFVWGFTHWGFFPAQQARLIGITGVRGASVILSLNASFMYFGFSLGATLGALVLSIGSVADLGWVGGLCVVAALCLFLATRGGRLAPA